MRDISNAHGRATIGSSNPNKNHRVRSCPLRARATTHYGTQMPRPPAPVEIDAVALAVLREKDGHSKSSLAEAAGMSLGYLSDLESGRRKGNPEVITKLARALNVPRSMIEKRRQDEQVPA